MASITFSKLIAQSTFRKPATRLYPFEKRPPTDATRGQISFDEKTCVYCSICAKKCPTNAIQINRKAKLWRINQGKCIICSGCVEVCPKDSLKMIGTPAGPSTMAQWKAIHKELAEAAAAPPIQAPATAAPSAPAATPAKAIA